METKICLKGHKSLVLPTIVWMFGTTLLVAEAKSEEVKAPSLDEIVGIYVYAGDRDKDENTVKAKIEKSTEEMNFLVLR